MLRHGGQHSDSNALEIGWTDVISFQIQWNFLLNVDVPLVAGAYNRDSHLVEDRTLSGLRVINPYLSPLRPAVQVSFPVGSHGGQLTLERMNGFARSYLFAIEESWKRGYQLVDGVTHVLPIVDV
jgi:hypothetical protein